MYVSQFNCIIQKGQELSYPLFLIEMPAQYSVDVYDQTFLEQFAAFKIASFHDSFRFPVLGGFGL